MSNSNLSPNSTRRSSADSFALSASTAVTTHATSSPEAIQTSGDVSDSRSCSPTNTALNEEDKAVIRAKSFRLAQLPPFTVADVDDLSQELTLAWARSQTRFDAARGAMRVLRTTVLERTAAKLLRKARAKKRFGIPTTSLDVVGTPSSAGQIARDLRRATSDGSRLTSQEEVDLRLDLQKLQSQLPPNLNELCELLKEQTVAEISRDLGIPASTVSSQVSLIRRRFESAKFRELL
ncbi:MAG: hypothetical protein JWN70_614 [Planctomycetaceae bacterium]|nr:hypothetical protein [Planctomycetaceae bacterium]